jgi:hypothetical protein
MHTNMKRVAVLLLLLPFPLTHEASAQTTATYSGVIKDLTQAVVTSGQVSFTLSLPTDSTIPGVGRFTPTTINCNINTDGTLSGYVGGVVSGACKVTMNTAISPSGTAYRVCIQAYFVTPGACFYDFAINDRDITTVVPTLSTGPVNYGGVPGPPLNFIGVWDSARVYTVGQVVSFSNQVYISLVNPNLNHTPSSSPTQWSIVVSPASLLAAPTNTQTVAQPANTSFNVTTSGTGKVKYNGSQVLNEASGILLNPTADQIITQPAGSKLGINTACIGSGELNAIGCFGANPAFNLFTCTISAGTAALSCPGAAFTSAFVGYEAYISHAGSSGATLTSSIAAFVDATHVTLASSALTTATTQEAVFGVDNTAALQAAFNAALTAGRTLYIPGGVYIHHGLNWTTRNPHVRGDAHTGTFLLAMAVTNPGKVNLSAQTTGVDISGSELNQFDDLIFYGGWDGNFADVSPNVNVLGARTVAGTNGFFSIDHVFTSDWFRGNGPYNVVLIGYEDTDMLNNHFESTGPVNNGTLYISGVNTPGFISPYLNIDNVFHSMTKMNISGGRTNFACSGKCVVFDEGSSQSIYNFSIRDAYFTDQSAVNSGTVFFSDTGPSGVAGMRHIVLDTINIETHNCNNCQAVNIAAPAWNWRIENVQFYGTVGQNNTSGWVFQNGFLDGQVLIDSTGQASGGAPEFNSPSCKGSILHLGEQQATVNCTDYEYVSGVHGGGQFNTGNAYLFNNAAGITGSVTAGACVLHFQGGIVTSTSGTC